MTMKILVGVNAAGVIVSGQVIPARVVQSNGDTSYRAEAEYWVELVNSIAALIESGGRFVVRDKPVEIGGRFEP